MSQRLVNKVAIITGGSQGIGKGIAKLFATHGAKLVITGLELAALEQAAHEIGGDIIPVVANVANAKDNQKMVQAALAAYGRIDILCQNAGIYPSVLLREMTEEQWDEVYNVNLKGGYLSLKACLPVMEQQGYGRVIVMSSVTGTKLTQAGYAHYAASKAGLTGLIKTAALELASSGITVNGIAPGDILTERSLAYSSDSLNALQQLIPLKMGTVEDVAYAALFLASDEARYITGEIITVDGGQTLSDGPLIEL